MKALQGGFRVKVAVADPGLDLTGCVTLSSWDGGWGDGS